MDSIKKERVCPTCGQPLHLVKSEKQPIEHVNSEKDKEMNKKTFAIFEIWNCLNCNEEMEFDVNNAIWKEYIKKRITGISK
ncbi:MAG: hypothetical protein KAI20_05975 [Thermoplasmatales archaeon]|nr:hypothetical protein [Thermoplasmatales archaeon]